ncbi:MAG: nuclear transport factor 2 family protein [Novosphingobium sp.]|nr:nuclear transport factor 2 family protein [Novosphingobium sp.]
MTDKDLQRLKDELEIRNLVGKLATMADLAEDLTEYFTFWTDDAVFDMREPFGKQPDDPPTAWKVSGIEALRENRKQLRDTGFQGPDTNVWHANTTLHITLNDETNAEAESYWVLYGSKDKVEVLRIGHYHDKFRKEDGRWKMAYRTVTPGRAGTIPPMAADR